MTDVISDEWRVALAAGAQGRIIKSLEWTTDDDGDHGYWAMTFTDGSEISWAATMAEEAARDTQREAAEQRDKARIDALPGPCCQPGYVKRAIIPTGWTLAATELGFTAESLAVHMGASLVVGARGGCLCGTCGAIWRVVSGAWEREPAPGA